MPTLRYVAYARREQRETLYYRVESEIEIEDYSGDRAPWQWWRIVRERGRKPRNNSEDRSGGSEDGSGNSNEEEDNEDGDENDSDEFVEVRQIPTWEGERVRTFLRNADMETAENFDGNYTYSGDSYHIRSYRCFETEIFKPLR